MVGKKLSHYNITDELGRGGMGIVYKAKDTKLDRVVAIKVLPPAALASEDDRARFYREAKAAAALHHPNIASVFEIDEAVPEGSSDDDVRPFIAMEFIDGGTLQDRIRERPVEIKQALEIAIQVASALDLAHGKNIVHRDVKSGNVMVSSDGTAKILDFGLAQTAQSTKLTRMGSTVGTIAYMSPEQARGEEVDLRTDLWSLGVVLYEMISGRYPFPGDYEQAVVYSILNNQPEPLTAVRSGVPMQLEWIVNKLLAKDAKDRYQTAKDLIVDLRNVPDVSTTTTTTQSAVSVAGLAASAPAKKLVAPTWIMVTGALLAGIVLTATAFFLTRQDPPPANLMRMEVGFPEMQTLAFPTVSPDNRFMAFIGTDVQERDGVFLRNMATGEIRYLEGSNEVGDREIGFSPDGERIAFNSGFNGGLFVSVVPNGIAERITDYGRFATWEDDETVVMSDDSPGGGESYRVNIKTREVQQIDVDDPKLGEGFGNVIKTVIPGTQRFFGHQIIRFEGGNVGQESSLFTLNAKTGQVDIIARNAINPLWVPGGFLTYQLGDDDGRLVIRKIDPSTGQFTGAPEDALSSGETTPWSAYSITPSGDLVYIPDDFTTGLQNVLWLVDMEAKRSVEISSGGQDGLQVQFPSFSPDDNLIAFNSDNGTTGDLFVYDVLADIRYQYTYSGRHGGGRFTADSDTVYYAKAAEGGQGPAIYKRAVGAEGVEQKIHDGAFLPTVSPDGSYVIATGMPPGHGFNLVRIDTRDGSASKLPVIRNGVVTPDSSQGMLASFSPSGQYLAYQPSGNNLVVGDILVRSMDGQMSLQIPGVQGFHPIWSRDGRYIYYATYGNIFRIPVRTQPAFGVVGEPQWVVSAGEISGFDVSSDNLTIVVSAVQVAFDRDREGGNRVVWLQKWSDNLSGLYNR